jgi:hypothetical protein
VFDSVRCQLWGLCHVMSMFGWVNCTVRMSVAAAADDDDDSVAAVY